MTVSTASKAQPSTPWPVDRTIPKWDWQPPTGTRVISADDHVMEHDLWIDKLAPSDRDRAPRITKDDRGFHLTIEGQPADQPGFNSLIVEGRPGAVDVQQRLRDMDAEGVNASFLFAQRTMVFFARISDEDFRIRCIDAYNEWLSEVQTEGGGRLYGVAILPTITCPEATRDYIQKLDDLGFVAMQLPSFPKDVRYNASAMEPMWDAIEESGIPLSFHVGAGSSLRGAGALGTSVTAALQPFRELWCLLTFSGILERHPSLRVVFTEGGISWVPSALFDADKQYKAFATELRPRLGELPSFYWYRQCYATFMNDPAGVKLVDDIGLDNVLWSVDYPHPESNLGESMAVMQSIFDKLGDHAARAVVGENAIRLWNLDPARILGTTI
jgi:predicted TIM-barrel fold metal-dependent hydrolase